MSAFAQTAPAQTIPTQTAAPQTHTPWIADLETRIANAVQEIDQDPRFKNLTEPQRRERVEFVSGNVLFALIHEIGHMLIAEMGLPVLGREEDAADAFAVLTGLKLGDAFSDRMLTESARGWFLSDKRNEKQQIKTVYYDEHGLDKQRAYNIVCLMVGGNPDKFSKLADTTKMPEKRQGTCQGDFSNASWSWEKVLAPHVRKADEPKTKIDVVYVDSSAYKAFVRGFRHIRLLETLADHLSNRFVWRRPISFEMTSCNEPSARTDLAARKIIVCYELAADFAELYRDYAVE